MTCSICSSAFAAHRGTSSSVSPSAAALTAVGSPGSARAAFSPAVFRVAGFVPPAVAVAVARAAVFRDVAFAVAAFLFFACGMAHLPGLAIGGNGPSSLPWSTTGWPDSCQRIALR